VTSATSRESIGERLRRLRLEQGLSQRALASRGVGYAYISRIERGERVPSMKAMRALAARLGVTPHYLETGDELPEHDARALKLGEAELALRLDADAARAEAQFREVLDDATAAGDVRGATRAQIGLGLVAAHRGDHEQVIGLLEAVVGLPWVTPGTYPDVFATLGHSYASHGDGRRAAELFARAIDELRRSTPVPAAALVRFATYRSYALSDLGELDDARNAISEALEYAAEVDDAYTRIRLYWSNARLASRQGDHDSARLSINRAIALLEASEDTVQLGRAHLLAAELSLFDHDPYDALAHLERAEPFLSPASDLQDRAWFAIQRALAWARAREPGIAIDSAADAVELLSDEEDTLLHGYAQWALGEALAAAGSATTARAAFTKASALIPPGSRYAAPFLDAWSRIYPADAEADVR
jgi:transcriptional regulator with XRE-family HTH domain